MQANVNGVQLYYEVHGRDGAPWLMLSHSLMCSVRMWDPQLEALAGDFRLLAYDARGHGRSSPTAPPYDFGLLAEDAWQLLRHLGIGRTHFAGLSMGGMTGEALALAHPEVLDRLVLADTGHAATPEAAAAWAERIRLAQARGMEALVEPTLDRWFTEDFRRRRPAPVAKVGEMIRGTPLQGFIGCAHALMTANFTARLQDIRCPTLAIAGEQDASAPTTRYLGANIPGARTVMIPAAAHISNVEQPEAFTRALRDFLRPD